MFWPAREPGGVQLVSALVSAVPVTCWTGACKLELLPFVQTLPLEPGGTSLQVEKGAAAS